MFQVDWAMCAKLNIVLRSIVNILRGLITSRTMAAKQTCFKSVCDISMRGKDVTCLALQACDLVTILKRENLHLELM